ncbi:universal stress protein [Halomarina litorea]|uniref:universal stress protein n=1 Tax=Halomarina litorea TaxID=2961595 RepID=UPI0020C3A3E1|nr:universal stress protein [Halomarina sp. BCD28]
MTNVLVPHDGSEQADRALSHAMEVFPHARLTLLTVIDPAMGFTGPNAPGTAEVWYESAQKRAAEWLEAARETAEADGMNVETVVETGRPARVIIEYAETHPVDHVVMGSQGREGVSRLLLGSVAETVVRRSPVPVTVVRCTMPVDERRVGETDPSPAKQ